MAGFQSDQEDLHPSSKPAFDFADFPEDVQISILSFLSPQDVAVFSSTCKRLLELCWDDAKGICDSMSLVFFLVSYDDLGGLVCLKIGDTSEQLAGCSPLPVFWTSNSKFVDSPLSSDEDELYSRRIHVRPLSANCIYQWPQFVENEVVMHSLCINSSYDLICGYQISSTSIPRKDEGRVWQYVDGGL